MIPALAISAAFSLSFVLGVQAQTYSATYLPGNAPNHTEQGQEGYNQCGSGWSQDSKCQNAYINSLDDFCLWAPPNPGPKSTIGETERFEVSWCMKPGYGTRLIPDGSITGAHFVQTPDYLQLTGVGDFTKMNVPKGDAGGELDPHGADGNGNPIGGLVFTSAFTGKIQQVHEWTSFMAANQFCFRACKPGVKNAPALCNHIYDVQGCEWNMPGNYNPKVFEQCAGDTGLAPGVYGTSTWHQGDGNTPAPHPKAPSSKCTTTSTIGDGLVVSGTVIISTPGASSTASGASITSPPSSSGSGAQPSSTSTSGSIASLAISGGAILIGALAVLVAF